MATIGTSAGHRVRSARTARGRDGAADRARDGGPRGAGTHRGAGAQECAGRAARRRSFRWPTRARIPRASASTCRKRRVCCPGSIARASLVTGRTRALAVPATALIRRSEVTAVYVIDAQDRAAAAPGAARRVRGRGSGRSPGRTHRRRARGDRTRCARASSGRLIGGCSADAAPPPHSRARLHNEEQTHGTHRRFWAPASAACRWPTR